ncbi:MAG: type II toxin-antitoxin system VapC family toxin [Gemmatimonadetes bacterium]|nr:type II toxin-antitoxin system VapC family toxin [Gemmatimonadota bacterium]
MIVADTNLIAYLLIPGPFSTDAERVRVRDPDWRAPWLWRSEFLNVLSLYLRTGTMTLAEAHAAWARARRLLAGREFSVRGAAVLDLAATSRCKAYDCEFVLGAQNAGVPLVTADAKVLAAFPGVAVSIQSFAG